MASGPNFNAHRLNFYVQYWDGEWRRKTISKKYLDWTPDKPIPKITTHMKAEYARLAEVERVAKIKLANYDGAPESLADFLLAHSESYRTSTKRSIEMVCSHFLAWCKSKRIERVDKITVAVCAQWLDDRMNTVVPGTSRTVAPSTLKRERIQLSRAWSKAVKKKMLPDNPWTATDLPAKIIPKKRGAWTREQYKKLLQNCRPWLKDLVTLGCNTGLRISALMALKWDDVEWGGKDGFGYVRLRAENDKVGKGYRLAMTKECYDVLSRRAGAYDPVFVLTGHLGKPVTCRAAVATAIRRACHRAKLSNPDSPCHHMRRSFGRWMIHGHIGTNKAGLFDVMGMLGHSSTKTTMIYLDVAQEDTTRFMVRPEDMLQQATHPS